MNNSSDHQLFVISAPSAGGKTTIIERLTKQLGGALKRVITCTTRAPREGEKEGVHYKFLSREKFEKLLSEGAFIEHAQVYGNWYGVLKADIEAKGRKIISLDSKGVENFQKMKVKASYILIVPPSIEELRRRLEARASESKEEMDLRLAEAKKEMEQADEFDHVVVNDKLDKAIEHCKNIIMGELKE